VNPSSLAVSLIGVVLMAGGAEHAVAQTPGASEGTVVPAQHGGPDARESTVPSLAATIEAMPKNLPRAPGPSLLAAIEAARAAQKACVAKGVKVSVLVADSVGEPVVLLSGDGAGVRSQLITRTKVAIVVRYKLPSGEVAAKAETTPRLNAEAAADPNIGVLRGGGFPVFRNGAMIGAVAVSGASLGGAVGLDEECAKVAVKLLEARNVMSNTASLAPSYAPGARRVTLVQYTPWYESGPAQDSGVMTRFRSLKRGRLMTVVKSATANTPMKRSLLESS
jgi:uncharacterized protein GlcG (DUF336 family)